MRAPAPFPVRCAIPFIVAPTGTMANNGAITLGTALPTTYANAFIFLPANAIVAGSAAGWYFCQMSSTTVGTVFNNTYTSGVPIIPAPVAFVTTGPGAYTGVTSAVAGPTISIPGGALGPNGILRVSHDWSVNNTAGAKGLACSYGGTNIFSATGASLAALYAQSKLINRGVPNAQQAIPTAALGPGSGTGGAGTFVYGSVNSAVAQNLAFGVTLAVATDLAVLESFIIEVLPG